MKKSLVVLFTAVIFLGVAGVVLADSITLPNPLCLTGGSQGAPCINSFPGLLAAAAGYIINFVVAPLTALMLVIAGILFVTSGGNPGRIETAKKCAIFAAVGAAIALAGTGLIAVIKAVIGVS